MKLKKQKRIAKMFISFYK